MEKFQSDKFTLQSSEADTIELTFEELGELLVLALDVILENPDNERKIDPARDSWKLAKRPPNNARQQ